MPPSQPGQSFGVPLPPPPQTMNEIASFPPPIRPQFPPGSVRPGLPPLQPVNETHAGAASQGGMTPRPGLSSLTTEISTATTTVYWAISGKHV
eukprot:m.302350 g.302350  ORF g.302350 m.302350 type:complete len:93 (+) comp40813_c0_seq52:271-549(+)